MSAVNSAICMGALTHERLEPVRHAFRYPALTFALDLEELPALSQQSFLFRHNRFGVFSVYDADYLWPREGTLLSKLRRFLEPRGLADGIKRIMLVTSPRLFGYVFNPVSFYLCYGTDDKIRCAVAEVNNTFGERHLYLLSSPEGIARDGARFRADKEFHVSPFHDMEGRYEFAFGNLRDGLDIAINLVREGRTVFHARLTGTLSPLTPAALRRALVRYPLSTFLTLPRIHIQAAILYFGKHLPVFHKPVPRSDLSIVTASAGWADRLCRRLFNGYVSRLSRGTLRIRYPDGSEKTFGGAQPGTCAAMHIREHRFFRRVVASGDVGLGEAYTDGLWDSDDVTAVLTVFVENMDLYSHPILRLPSPQKWLNRWRHRKRSNTVRQSRRNISAHYDLGNEFYGTFLDNSLTYSCALFQKPSDSLEKAQEQKLEAIERLAGIRPGERVLEIGSGWGSFALHAARAIGCHVTTVTLSERQLEVVRERAAAAGLADRVDVRLCDYRRIQGLFDRIVSIEMLEAVGHENFGMFFAKLDSLLKPGGRVAIQVITMPDQRYEQYRRGCDWIQKHIFPGGHLPSLGALVEAMRDHSRFVVERLIDLGDNYARTLREWHHRFVANREAIAAQGYSEKFLRSWEYYLQYCESGFATRTLGVLQMTLRRYGE
ncbi:MAG: DUF1365 family protein [Candidatus Sumerlaeaceae bacterium]|nr:DUF1365 family protein [Candidatus Sumerlaeaceae bacterium]